MLKYTMNRLILFAAIFLVAFALVLGGLWYLKGSNDSNPSSSDGLTKVNGDTEQGHVSIAATFITKQNAGDIGAQSYDLNKNYVFFIEMNTHSVDVAKIDIAKLSSLKADGANLKGNWRQTMESIGHHRNGFLVFAKRANANNLELTIRDIANVSIRTLTWKL